MRPINSDNTVQTASKHSLSPPAMGQPRSPWHSPVPYLFGGLAAMLGLIAFALLILACSYWRLSSRLENQGEGDEAEAERDVENGENEGESTKQVKVYEEKILVIMAGQDKPTYLATPVYTKASSFGDENCNFDQESLEKGENGDQKVKEEMGHDDNEQLSTRTENSENHHGHGSHGTREQN